MKLKLTLFLAIFASVVAFADDLTLEIDGVAVRREVAERLEEIFKAPSKSFAFHLVGPEENGEKIKGNVYSVRSWLSRRIYVYIGANEQIILNDIKAVNRFLDVSSARLTPDELAGILSNCLIYPTGIVAGHRSKNDLSEWMKGSEKDPLILRAYMDSKLHFEKGAKGEWTLGFLLIKTDGGVERVKAKGRSKPLFVEVFTSETVAPAGSFYWPYEG